MNFFSELKKTFHTVKVKSIEHNRCAVSICFVVLFEFYNFISGKSTDYCSTDKLDESLYVG